MNKEPEKKDGQAAAAQLIAAEFSKEDSELKKAKQIEETSKKSIIEKSEKKVIELCDDIDKQESSLSPKLCELQINLGEYLDRIEENYDTKSDYTTWLEGYRKDHGSRHTRMFQRAKQLYRIGEFAKSHIHIGLFRLLEWDQMLNYEFKERNKKNIKNKTVKEKIEEKKKISDEILAKYNSNIKNNNKLEKEEVSAIITLQRFHTIKIDYIKFDQAKKMVEQEYGSIKVNKVGEIKKWLDSLDESLREEKINKFIDGKMMKYPDGWEPTTGSNKISIKTFIKRFVSIGEKVDFDNANLKKFTTEEIEELKKAHKIIESLNKIGISTEVKKEEFEDGQENVTLPAMGSKESSKRSNGSGRALAGAVN